MKAVILAGGLGTRISEDSAIRPKPMIEIGGKPILWHIMKHYSHFGINEFIVCCGYKGYVIKEYFANYSLHLSDVTFDIANDSIEIHRKRAEPWRITLVDTGESSETGGRIRRVEDYVSDDFCMTYGDGLGAIDILRSIEFHKKHGKLATMTAVQPPGRFGSLKINGDVVDSFVEKPDGDGGWINGGFFVLNKGIFNYLKSDLEPWEREPLQNLAKDGELMCFHHSGFWQPMDTLRDKNYLEALWQSGNPPWRLWKDV